MQTVPAGFTTGTAATVRRPCSLVEIMWDGANWTDETAYWVSDTGVMRLSAPSDDLIPPGDVGTVTVILSNPGGRFSWKNEDGALFEHIGGVTGMFGIRVRLSKGFYYADVHLSPPVVPVFTGVIYDWQEGPSEGTITLFLRDIGFKYLQDKASCLMQVDQRADQLISYFAGLAGITSGNMALEPSSVIIPFGWLDDESILEEMWEVSRSVEGWLFFDQAGILRFWNPTHLASQTTPVWTFSPGDFTDYRPSHATDSLADKIVVEWSGRYIGVKEKAYTLNEVKVIRPGETLTFEARFNNPLYGYIALSSITDYKVITGGGVDIASEVSITLPVEQRFAQRCTVQVVNNHTTLAAMLIKLEIRGYPLVGGPTDQVTVDAPTGSLPFKRTRSVRGNMYVQTATQAQALADHLSARFRRVIPTWQLANVRGVPQLELGDRIAFSDPDHLTDAREGYVMEISWRDSSEGAFTQDITLLDANELYPYNNFFVIGETALGFTGRAWY